MTSLLTRHKGQLSVNYLKKPIITRAKLGQQKSSKNTKNTLLQNPHVTLKRSSKIPDIKKSKPNSNSIDIKVSGNSKLKKSVKKSDRPTSVPINVNVEFYPDRPKRKTVLKKIVLQPKHDYKVVATTNKRKTRIPHREEINVSPPRLQPLTNTSCKEEQSMEELVRLAEEQGIDDEDLLEILTCPSPVWWEDLSDDDDQEEIYMRFHEEAMEEDFPSNEEFCESLKINNNPAKAGSIDSTITKTKHTGVNLKEDVNFFKKFVEKRTKLEHVLGKIKFSKTNAQYQSCCFQESNDKSSGKVRNDSVGALSDDSINAEELLNTLENIEIPVRKYGSDNEHNTVIDNLKSNYVEIDSHNESTCKVSKNKKHTYESLNNSNVLKIKCNENNDLQILSNEIVNSNLELVAPNLPPLTKNPFGSIDVNPVCISPKSVDSIASESTSSVIELDSISDTNIKFLDEFDDKNDKSESNSELVTLYRIISEQSVDVEDKIKANVVEKSDGITKKCNGHKNKDTKLKLNDKGTVKNYQNKLDQFINQKHIYSDPNKPEDRLNYEGNIVKSRTILIPNSKVKYCHDCSNVFETDVCPYCLKKSRNLK